MSNVSKLSNVGASIVGAAATYLIQSIPDETIKTSLLAAIPPLTLFVAYITKVFGNFTTSGFFSYLLASTSAERLEELRVALEDPILTPEEKADYKQHYAEAYRIKLDVKRNKVNTYNRLATNARESMETEIANGYRDNAELTEGLNSSKNKGND